MVWINFNFIDRFHLHIQYYKKNTVFFTVQELRDAFSHTFKGWGFRVKKNKPENIFMISDMNNKKKPAVLHF